MKSLIEKYKKLQIQKNCIRVEEIIVENEFLKFAKFRIGDIIEYDEGYDNITNGIIRSIYSIADDSDELSICYDIGKVKKNGKIHLTQNINYSRVLEPTLNLVK